MKSYKLIVLAALAAGSSIALAQSAAPGKPEENGVSPKSSTIFVNLPADGPNNNKTESIGVAIASNGNVLVGWEDDGSDLTDNEAVWRLYGPNGTELTPSIAINSLKGGSVTQPYRAFFRADKSPTPGNTAWGPKIKANLWGNGLGMGSIAYAINDEVPETAPFQVNAAGENVGDFPAVQLLNDDGTPRAIVAGVSAAIAQNPGNIRIGDWDYLSNGNVLIVNESRQNDDLVNLFGGDTGQQHVTYRIVDATGAEVKATALVSSTKTKSNMWHGSGATKDGFAIRFAGDDNRAKVRLFKNDGTPVGDNIDLGTLTGNEALAGGGRGDGVGFHGNGNDAYAVIGSGVDGDGKKAVFVTVLNADGTVRWTKNVSDDIELASIGRLDVGIDWNGRVVVAYTDSGALGTQLTLGRVLDRNGKPLGGTFYVSEKEAPDLTPLQSIEPRVAFRGNQVAFAWESKNGGVDESVVALRIFEVAAISDADSVGLKRIVPDKVIFKGEADNLDNWEPYTSVLGNSTFLIEANTFASDDPANQNYALAFQPVAGGEAKFGSVFHADDGTPFKSTVNKSRQNGNPGRVAGDKRPGAVNFIAGGEASPHAFAALNTGGRLNLGFDRLENGRYATVQTYSLDAALTQTPLSKVIDSANGRLTSGVAPDPQISRFGGELAGLDNGNFVSVVEDKTKLRNAGGDAAVATILAPDGSVVVDTFKVADGSIWSNVAAYKGGFAVRVGGVIRFIDNNGVEKGTADQGLATGSNLDRGRGDGTRLAGHINSPYVALAGVSSAVVDGATVKSVRVAVFDSRDFSLVAEGEVSPAESGAADRTTVAMDALGRIAVAYEIKPPGWEQNQIAVRVLAVDGANKKLTSLTAPFFPFINHHPAAISVIRPNISMTTKQILVTGKGNVNLANQPDNGPDSPGRTALYVVLDHPAPAEDPTPTSGSSVGTPAVITGIKDNGATITINWTGGNGTVQKRAAAGSGAWTDVTTGNGTATIAKDGAAGFIRIAR